MTTYTLLFDKDTVFTDKFNAPLSGGLVTLYASGSLTPATSYTNSTGGTPNTLTSAGAITLSSSGTIGTAQCWVSSNTLYTLRVQNSLGADIFTIKDIFGAPNSIYPVLNTVTLQQFVNGTANKLLGFDNTGALSDVSVGSNLKILNNTINFTGTYIPEGIIKLSTQSISGVSSFTFDNTMLKSTYSSYYIELYNITCSSTCDMFLRTSTDNGSTVFNGSSDYRTIHLTQYNATNRGMAIVNPSGMYLNHRTSDTAGGSDLTMLSGTGTQQLAFFGLTVTNLASSTLRTVVDVDACYIESGANHLVRIKSRLGRAAATAENAITLNVSAGTLTATAQIYGLVE